MICRLWRGWTTRAQAEAYEGIVRGQVIPGIEAMHVWGLRHIDLLRRPLLTEDRIEFTTLMWFDDLDAVRRFVGEDYEISHVPAEARDILEDFDRRAAHFDVLDRRNQESEAPDFNPTPHLPDDAALIVIDVQKGFDDPTWGERSNPAAEKNIEALITTWRQAGRPIRHVHHASRSPDGKFRRGTLGHAPQAYAQPAEGEPIHVKEVNSGFIGTDLEKDLRAAHVQTVVVLGFTTNHCVSTTTRMAGNLGFRTLLVSDATAAYERRGLDGAMRPAEDVHAAAVSDLAEEFAEIVSTDQVLDALRRGDADP